MANPFFDQPGRDGRRKSDPLKSLDGAPARAPDWQLNRVITTQDITFVKRQDGVNCGQYKTIRFNVVPFAADPRTGGAPGGTANPNVEARVWSEAAGAFVPFDTAITKSGAGAGVAYMVDVSNANGSIVGLFVVNALAAVVAVYVQGHDIDS